MATFTITAAQNIDELTTKAGADTYNVNGGTLTIDQNTLFGQNTGTAGGLGNITISASLGGTVEIDGRYVRQIAYTSGSGNVPAYNTTISIGSASGKLIGVVSGIQAAPTAPGAAMPASGFILIKQWNQVEYTSGALTGITATASGASVPAMLYIVGNENASRAITCPRLGLFRIRGDWYQIGTTDGVASTTYTWPTYGQSNCVLPGVWVETGSGTNEYEFYTYQPITGANTTATDTRGKVIYENSVTGATPTFRFGNDGTNTVGYVPPTGRKIRIPNVYLANTSTTSITAPTTTVATRPEFVTTGGGVVSISNAIMCWYLNVSQAYSISITDTAIADLAILSEVATQITATNLAIAPISTTVQLPLSLTYNYAGGSFSGCVFSRYSLAASGAATVSLTDCSGGFTFSNCKNINLTATRGNATVYTLFATRVDGLTITSPTIIGAQIGLTTCKNVSITDISYADSIVGRTLSTNPMSAVTVGTSSSNVTVSGFTLLASACGPYTSILNVGSAGNNTIKLRNIGTFASPLDMSFAPVEVAWTRSTTTATVTLSNHGFIRANEAFFVKTSSSTGAITNVTSYTVLAYTSSSVFTFACTNGGNTSGTAVIVGGGGPPITIAGSAASQNISVQRVYVKNVRAGTIGPDNSTKDLIIEDCVFDANQLVNPYALNMTLRNTHGCSPVVTASNAIYGTHWLEGKAVETLSSTSASWSRSSTTVTFSINAHGLHHNDVIFITGSSQTTPLPNGRYIATVPGTLNSFTVTGVNSGATSGTANVTSANGRIILVMNEATTSTTSHYTKDAGTPNFTSAGTLYMPTINDQITYETPKYLKNATAFRVAEVEMAGGTLTNYDLTYSIDKNDGNGFSVYKLLSYPRAGGGGSSGSTNVTMTDTTGVVEGSYIFGTGIAFGAKVSSITNGTTVVVDTANTGTVSGILRFNELPNEASLSATNGYKLKVRIKTTKTNTTAISSLIIHTNAGATGNQNPLDLATLTLTGLKNPSEVRVYNAGTTTEIAGEESVTSGTFTAQIDAGAYSSIDLSILSLGYQNTRLTSVPFTAAGYSTLISQVLDRQYYNG